MRRTKFKNPDGPPGSPSSQRYNFENYWTFVNSFWKQHLQFNSTLHFVLDFTAIRSRFVSMKLFTWCAMKTTPPTLYYYLLRYKLFGLLKFNRKQNKKNKQLLHSLYYLRSIVFMRKKCYVFRVLVEFSGSLGSYGVKEAIAKI